MDMTKIKQLLHPFGSYYSIEFCSFFAAFVGGNGSSGSGSFPPPPDTVTVVCSLELLSSYFGLSEIPTVDSSISSYLLFLNNFLIQLEDMPNRPIPLSHIQK